MVRRCSSHCSDNAKIFLFLKVKISNLKNSFLMLASFHVTYISRDVHKYIYVFSRRHVKYVIALNRGN